MLHAAAMFAGIFIVCLLLTARTGGVEDYAVAGAIALACVGVAFLLGGVRRNPFSSAPQLLILVFARMGAQLRGALATIRAALAADVTLQPALVRVRTTAGPFAKAAMIDLASAAPGAFVVDSDAEGVLLHVTDESAIGESELSALERRAASLLGSAQ